MKEEKMEIENEVIQKGGWREEVEKNVYCSHAGETKYIVRAASSVSIPQPHDSPNP